MAERSRRRLSYSSVSTLGEKGEVCGLCSRASIRTSRYPSWTDKSSQQCVQSLGVDVQSPVCRACRDDVSRLVKSILGCTRWSQWHLGLGVWFWKTRIWRRNWRRSIKFNIAWSVLSTLFSVCQACIFTRFSHYYLVYNKNLLTFTKN